MTQLDDFVNRPRRYVAQDGAMELMIGLMLVSAMAAFTLVPARFFLVPQALWILSSLGMAWGAKKLKEVTSARGGYVALEAPRPVTQWNISGRRFTLVVAFGVMALMIVARDVFEPSRTSEAVAASAVFVAIYLYEAVKYRQAGQLGLAVCAAAAGLWAYVWNDTLLFVVAVQGVALACLGAGKLWRFMATHPATVDA